MFPLLAAPLARRGIQLTYAATPAEALDAGQARYYDALMIYGNHTAITPEQEKALLDFVEGGHGADRAAFRVGGVHRVGQVHRARRRRSSSGTAPASSLPRSCSRRIP